MLYGLEGNPTARQLVEELGELGTKLGSEIDLDETQTCYFLLLGQSLAKKIMPKQGQTEEGESDE
jgi:CRISPR-associated protein Csh1